MKVVILSELELKSLGEAFNRDYLELCHKHKVNPDVMDQPGKFPNPLEGLYKRIHFTFHRWLSEVGSDTRVEQMNTDIMKQRKRELRWQDIGLETERWIDEAVDGVYEKRAVEDHASSLNHDDDEALYLAGHKAAREQLRQKLETYLAEPAKY